MLVVLSKRLGFRIKLGFLAKARWGAENGQRNRIGAVVAFRRSGTAAEGRRLLQNGCGTHEGMSTCSQTNGYVLIDDLKQGGTRPRGSLLVEAVLRAASSRTDLGTRKNVDKLDGRSGAAKGSPVFFRVPKC